MASKTLWDLLVAAGEATVTKAEFGKKMHDKDIPEEEKLILAQDVADMGGYENLPD